MTPLQLGDGRRLTPSPESAGESTGTWIAHMAHAVLQAYLNRNLKAQSREVEGGEDMEEEGGGGPEGGGTHSSSDELW